jgi:hypothetical protein
VVEVAVPAEVAEKSEVSVPAEVAEKSEVSVPAEVAEKSEVSVPAEVNIIRSGYCCKKFKSAVYIQQHYAS